MCPFLIDEGFEVFEFKYKFWPIINGLFSTHFKNDNLATKLVHICEEYQAKGYSITVIGHSNGCTITYLASFNFPFDQLVFINPALERNKAPICFENLVVYYSEHDVINRLGTYLNWIVPGDENNRPWGEMGTYGPSFVSPILQSVDESKLLGKEIGHSTVFKNENLHIFAEDLLKRII